MDYSKISDTNAFAIPITMQQEEILDINIYERVIIFTDNTICQRGLQKQTLYDAAFKPLRQTPLLAAQFDILLVPIWILGHTNSLADALSRFDFDH